MKYPHLFAVYVRLIATASIGVLMLALLFGAVGEASVKAAAGHTLRNDSGPSIQIVSITGTVPLYDPKPQDNMSKTLFFSNVVTGEITLTLEISGTPPFTLTSGATFQQEGRVFTATDAPATQWVTYSVGLAAGDYANVFYTVTDASELQNTFAISYLQDVTAPVVSTAVITAVGANLAAVDTTLYITDTSNGDFWISGHSVDAGAGYTLTSFSPAALGCGLIIQEPSLQADWSAQYHLCHLSSGQTLTATSQDQLGNAAAAVFSVTPDNLPPSSTVTTSVEQVIGLTTFPLTWTARDADSGLASITLYYQSDSSLWISYTTAAADHRQDSGSFVFTPPASDLLARKVITYSFATVAHDKVGNPEALPVVPDAQVLVKSANVYLPLILQNYPLVPQGSVAINSDQSYTYRREVTLNLTATVEGVPVDQMRLRNEGEAWGDLQAFATTWPFTLTPGSGGKTVYAQFKSAASGISAEASDAILLFENGDFEQDLAIGWRTESDGLPTARVTATADGTSMAGSAALLGKTDYACNNVPLGYAGLVQTVTIPAGGAKLTFKYFMLTWDGAPLGSTTYDDFEVRLGTATVYSDANRVTTGLSCDPWWRVPGTSNPRPNPNGQTGGWYEKTIDLSGYANQTIELAFRNYSRYDHWFNTYTYLDEVRLEP